MDIKSFCTLADDEKRSLYDFIVKFGTNFYFEDYVGMLRDYSGPVFSHGKGHFSIWENGNVKATAGVIVKDIEMKGDAVITGINIREADLAVFKPILDKAIAYAAEHIPKGVRLGLAMNRDYLFQAVMDYGFKEIYRAVIMKYNGSQILNAGIDNIKFEELSQSNRNVFQGISNSAFLGSPNGAMLSDEDMDNMMEEYSRDPSLAGICVYNSESAAIYELSIKGNTGWIEGLGVNPIYQGTGLGRAILKKSVDIFLERGIKDIKLFVLSANKRAVDLYWKNGFEDEKVSSVWFNKEI